jgi:DNA (cytosine-5)-methyltransferase 1
VGYARAGFEVVGVDLSPQPNYPFEFVQADALRISTAGFDAIHASPPCQAYSTQTADREAHPRLIADTRLHLRLAGVPYVIENVEGAKSELVGPVRLCGSSFGLDLRRHRYFETNWPATVPPCNHLWQTPRFQSLDASMVKRGRKASVVGVHGHLNYPGEADVRSRAMRIDWMTTKELAESIPPAFTEFLGRQLWAFLRAKQGLAA